MSEVRSIAISSNFAHHTTHSGYKQILRFTKPLAVFGIDYTKENSKIVQSYYYVHEFIAWFRSFSLKFDVLHILYGEDYFRFSHILFWRKKLVVTFHQPPDILDQELSLGNYNGRVAGFTHSITRRRLRSIDACIVMSKEQKEVAQKYIDSSKIHVIPLGVNLERYNLAFNKHEFSRDRDQVITVGEWLRDWDLYLKVVDECFLKSPETQFILINNRLNDQVLNEISSRKNVKYVMNITDAELEKLYLTSAAMFLPLKGAAGSNAINEALALGCPVISNLRFDFWLNIANSPLQ
ncbi:MAG: glycosyltransferase family 4 protein [Sphingobacteriaceae bacterium]|nr:glycosyltransferase family 4 protein [Sphingobacteriaceae bacterium]